MSLGLTKDSKPMRALHALADTHISEPLTEYAVWFAAGRIGGPWWALTTLVEQGLAERTLCRSDGAYAWYITDAGRARLWRDAP